MLGYGYRRHKTPPPHLSRQQHVLRLQVGVDDAAHAVQEVHADGHLPRVLAHQAQRDALVAVRLDERQQVVAQRLKHHAHVRAVRPRVQEVVHQAHHVRGERWGVEGEQVSQANDALPHGGRLLRVVVVGGQREPALCGGLLRGGHCEGPLLLQGRLGLRRALRRHLQDLNLVERGVHVVLRALLHLERHAFPRLAVRAQPHRGEVAPPQLAQHLVPSVVHLPHVHGVVAPPPVPLVAFKVAVRVVGALAGAVALRVAAGAPASLVVIIIVVRVVFPPAAAATTSAARTVASIAGCGAAPTTTRIGARRRACRWLCGYR